MLKADNSRWLVKLVPVIAIIGVVTPTLAGQNRTAHAIENGNIIATGRFVAGADRFEVTKNSATVGHRAYLEWKYITKNGEPIGGTHWGSSDVGRTVVFDHNFGKDRKVTFRVCVQKSLSPDKCSKWEVGYAG